MLRRDTVQLASFAWSFGVIALVLRSGLVDQRWSVETQSRSLDPLSLAATVLRTSDRFGSAAGGYAGTTPHEVLAWRVIFRAPRADNVFKDLLTSASVPGQLYALAGLRLRASADFARAAALLRANAGMVRTVRGGIVDDEAVADVVAEIEQGRWTREFLETRLMPSLSR